MRDYCIVTDSSANLPFSYLEQKEVLYFDVPYVVADVTYSDSNPLSIADFYAFLRAECTAYSTTPSTKSIEEFFRKIIREKDQDILAITLSSRLGSINSVMNTAAQNVLQEYPDYRITIIDSLSASLGEGLLVDMAAHFKQVGFLYNENISWLEKIKHHVIHSFTADDLNSLYRSNRISKPAAILGTLANIKLLLRLDPDGSISASKPVSSRKRAMEAIVDSIAPRIEHSNFAKNNSTIYISHGDCEADAVELSKMITARYGYTDFLILPISPTLGCYTGPGTLGVFYLGEYR